MLFDEAYKFTKKFEGGYAFDPNDKGGETYKGIARKYNKNWKGWDLIDKLKENFPKNISISKKATIINEAFQEDKDMLELVKDFYQNDQWPLANPLLPDKIRIKVFDTGVNMGFSRANKLLQKSLNDFGAQLTIDGKIGTKSLTAVNNYDIIKILNRYSVHQAEQYRAIAASDPTQEKFLSGWLRRAKWHPGR
jgi:lysozyme family protein